MTKKKPAATPTIKTLQKRIEQACADIACVTTLPFCMYESYQYLDHAVRVLQGKNYSKFVEEWTAPTELQPEGFLWRKGVPGEEDEWYGWDTQPRTKDPEPESEEPAHVCVFGQALEEDHRMSRKVAERLKLIIDEHKVDNDTSKILQSCAEILTGLRYEEFSKVAPD